MYDMYEPLLKLNEMNDWTVSFMMICTTFLPPTWRVTGAVHKAQLTEWYETGKRGIGTSLGAHKDETVFSFMSLDADFQPLFREFVIVLFWIYMHEASLNENISWSKFDVGTSSFIFSSSLKSTEDPNLSVFPFSLLSSEATHQNQPRLTNRCRLGCWTHLWDLHQFAFTIFAHSYKKWRRLWFSWFPLFQLPISLWSPVTIVSPSQFQF